MMNKCMCVGIDANSLEEAVKKMNEMIKNKILEHENVTVKDNPTYKVYVNGNTTTVEDAKGFRASAKCDPTDEFDVVTGIDIAISRLNVKNANKTDFENLLIKTLHMVGVTRLVRTELQGVDVLMGYKNGIEVAKQIIPNDVMNFMKKDISYSIYDLI